ncbi:hypothetical protein ACFQZJ_02580 [Maribacter chungangensis]|uniref:DUF3108 domain-containing protein n=1 Tax=Maribacter chungangensis TaxID=1069117 RepID=A0ABW3AZ37_9FLAO
MKFLAIKIIRVTNRFLFKGVVIGLFFTFPKMICAQEKETFLDEVQGTLSVTHNGIALVPSFSLGEPALLVDLKFRKGKFSFEPDMRFALEGKPWSMLFWFRYRAIEKKRFSLRTGIHPALNFRTVPVIRNGATEHILESRRYLAGELVPNYKISDKVNVGMYYLHGRGFDEGVKQVNFLVLNATFSEMRLSEKLQLAFTPQVYYLTSDNDKGYYTAGFLTLSKKKFPLSLTGIVNKAFATEIAPEDDFIWTVLLNYKILCASRKMMRLIEN